MIVAIKPNRSATMYEDMPIKNTGLDEILEITKIASASLYSESRPVLYFNTTDITQVLSDYGVSISNVTCSLIMNTVQMSEVPINYTIAVNAISGSWTNGTGRFADTELSGGISWTYKAGETSSPWMTSSFATGSTGTYNVTPGGGTWYTASAATQSFSFKQDNDLSVNISGIVRAWLTGSISNDGVIVRLSNVAVTDYLLPTNIQFYSANTHTVYGPSLRLEWNSVTEFITGSLVSIDIEDNPIIYLSGFKGEYKPNVKIRAFVRSRPMYPRHTFAQNSDYTTVKYLPSTSYYKIVDAATLETVVDYSEGTKLSCNTNGNYFDFSSTVLYPERFYKFEFKVVYSGTTEYFADNYMFKIVN